MNLLQPSLFCSAAALAILLPAPRSQSQLAQPTDPLATITALQTANDDLLKRQEATLKDLTELTDSAREIKIFSKRG